MRPRGRYPGYAGPRGMSSRNPSAPGIAALSAALLLAACGGLNSPDLATGQVSGRLAGAQPGAFAYALGAPQTKAEIAADGSYTINGVPVTATGTAPIVLFDGATKADIVAAPVKGASKTRADDTDASALALARKVTVTAACGGSVSPNNVTYEVEGVALRDDGTGPSATLFPLPPGKFKVRAHAKGMIDAEKDVDVSNGDDSADLEMQVEDGDTSNRGCLSNGCSVGDLKCDNDGRCYPCTSDSQCGAGMKCSNHQCQSENPDLKNICISCAVDSDCAYGPAGASQPGLCLLGTPTGNVCSHGCSTDLDCPSGFACGPATNGHLACLPFGGSNCSTFLAVFGRGCTNNTKEADCAGLADPKCVGSGHSNQPGYCSSRCTTQADSPSSLTLGTWVCDTTALVCVHP
jgi:hypothetical protein